MHPKHAESLFFKLLHIQLGSKFWFLMPTPTVDCDTFCEATQLTISIHTIYNIVQVSLMESLRNESIPCSILEIF